MTCSRINKEYLKSLIRSGHIAGIETVRFESMETVVAIVRCPKCGRNHSLEMDMHDSLFPSEEDAHAA